MKHEPGDILSVTHGDLRLVAIVCRVDGRHAEMTWITRPQDKEISSILTDGSYVAGLGWCEVEKVGHIDPGE